MVHCSLQGGMWHAKGLFLAHTPAWNTSTQVEEILKSVRITLWHWPIFCWACRKPGRRWTRGTNICLHHWPPGVRVILLWFTITIALSNNINLQFKNLKDGDRFFFTHRDGFFFNPNPFSEVQLENIKVLYLPGLAALKWELACNFVTSCWRTIY